MRALTLLPAAPQTVCFEGHDVTIVAADAVPVEPIAASKFNGCIDVNSGQRWAAGGAPGVSSSLTVLGCGWRLAHAARLHRLHAALQRSSKLRFGKPAGCPSPLSCTFCRAPSDALPDCLPAPAPPAGMMCCSPQTRPPATIGSPSTSSTAQAAPRVRQLALQSMQEAEGDLHPACST